MTSTTTVRTALLRIVASRHRLATVPRVPLATTASSTLLSSSTHNYSTISLSPSPPSSSSYGPLLCETSHSNNNIHYCHTTQRRWLSRKGARMGHHLETLEELAHRTSHENAKERRKAKKLHKKQHRHEAEEEESASTTSKMMQDTIPEHIEFDEDDDVFHLHGSGGTADEDDNMSPQLPDAHDVKKRMVRVVSRLKDSFKAIRGNEPTPELFDSIPVLVYGERTTLNAVAQVVITSPTLVTITCFDPTVAPDVRTAIQLALELNPQLDDKDNGVIVVKMPKPTLESRQQTVKLLGKQAESGRQRIRGIRRAAMDVVNKGKQGKLDGISKDDAFRVSKDIDVVTDEVITQLNDEVEAKQQSVMEV